MMRAITFTGCRAGAEAANRRRLAASCARAVAAHENRNSRAACDKAHARFLDQLRRTAARLEARTL